jgi:hypothetical protein
MKGYAIALAVLESFFWLVARAMALETVRWFPSVRASGVHIPAPVEFVCRVAPHAWIIPLSLMILVLAGWRRNGKLINHAVGITTLIFLIFLGLCMMAFTTLFFPKYDYPP